MANPEEFYIQALLAEATNSDSEKPVLQKLRNIDLALNTIVDPRHEHQPALLLAQVELLTSPAGSAMPVEDRFHYASTLAIALHDGIGPLVNKARRESDLAKICSREPAISDLAPYHEGQARRIDYTRRVLDSNIEPMVALAIALVGDPAVKDPARILIQATNLVSEDWLKKEARAKLQDGMMALAEKNEDALGTGILMTTGKLVARTYDDKAQQEKGFRFLEKILTPIAAAQPAKAVEFLQILPYENGRKSNGLIGDFAEEQVKEFSPLHRLGRKLGIDFNPNSIASASERLARENARGAAPANTPEPR